MKIHIKSSLSRAQFMDIIDQMFIYIDHTTQEEIGYEWAMNDIEILGQLHTRLKKIVEGYYLKKTNKDKNNN